MNLLLIAPICLLVFLAGSIVLLLRLTPHRSIKRRDRARFLEIERQKQAQADAFLSYAWIKAEREMLAERAANQVALNSSPDFYPNF